MKNLNLEKVWQLMNKLSLKMGELSDQEIFVYLLGMNSKYYGRSSFEDFLEHYSFRIQDNLLVVFNDEPIQWEDYSVDDFSYIPTALLSDFMSETDLDLWIEDEVQRQLAEQELEKSRRKESLKQQIKNLEKQLNNL